MPPQEGNLDVASLSSSMKREDSFICYKCKKSLKSARQLQTHQAFQHGSVEEEQIKCMVMKCGKMFRKTSTLDNHMKTHQETSQNILSNLFGPVLLQNKPKLAGLRFPLQQIQNRDSQTHPNGKQQDQNEKKSIISHQLPNQIPHQPWRNSVNIQQQKAQRSPKRIISADTNLFRPNKNVNTNQSKRIISADIDLFGPRHHQYQANMRQEKMHSKRTSLTNQQNMKMDIDANRGLRF